MIEFCSALAVLVAFFTAGALLDAFFGPPDH